MLIWGPPPFPRAPFEDDHPGLSVEWRPELDVFELPQQYLLRLSVPGVRPDDIDLTVQGRLMTVSGVRTAGVPETALAHLIESPRGRFARRVRLPPNADVSGIQTRLVDGELLVVVPKGVPPATRVVVTAAR